MKKKKVIPDGDYVVLMPTGTVIVNVVSLRYSLRVTVREGILRRSVNDHKEKSRLLAAVRRQYPDALVDPS